MKRLKHKIAFAGRIRSGKDTAAALSASIIREKDRGVMIEYHAYADGIAKVIKGNFPEAFSEGKPRKHYQVIGQTFRQLDPLVWVKHLQRELDQAEREWSYLGEDFAVIVTDLRQENELEQLHAEGFTTIKIVADEELRKERVIAKGDAWNEDSFNHETEQAVDGLGTHYVIENNGTIEELEAKIRSVLDDVVKTT